MIFLYFLYFLVMTVFPHFPDNTENKSEDTYHSRVYTGTPKGPAALLNCLSSHADTIPTMLATNKARIPDMSTLVESIEHLSKAASCLTKSDTNPENLTNANLEALRTQILQCYNSFLRLSPKKV